MAKPAKANVVITPVRWKVELKDFGDVGEILFDDDVAAYGLCLHGLSVVLLPGEMQELVNFIHKLNAGQ